ncbi:hypothetical protein ACFE04_011916 [Oxalis oulophora]
MELKHMVSKKASLFSQQFIQIGALASHRRKRGSSVICMGGRTLNRKPLQKGRNLSIEAIQSIQALKRAHKHNNSSTCSTSSFDQVFNSNFTRLLKFDMVAVLRELLRQNQCVLALKVFDIIRREHWYKPKVIIYADIIEVLAANSLFEEVDFVYQCLKSESEDLEPELRGFNSLFKTFLTCERIELVVDCYEFMKGVDCEPDKSTFKMLIRGLESNGKEGLSDVMRLDAQSIYGHLEFLDEEEEDIVQKDYWFYNKSFL